MRAKFRTWPPLRTYGGVVVKAAPKVYSVHALASFLFENSSSKEQQTFWESSFTMMSLQQLLRKSHFCLLTLQLCKQGIVIDSTFDKAIHKLVEKLPSNLQCWQRVHTQRFTALKIGGFLFKGKSYAFDNKMRKQIFQQYSIKIVCNCRICLGISKALNTCRAC